MGSVTSCFKFPDKKVANKVDIVPCDYNADEIHIIQKQWSIAMRNCDSVGYKLFEKLFQYKDIMAKFDFAVANNLDYKKTMNDARLSFHVRRVFHTINTVVTCLHDTEFATSQLEHVGAIHAEYGLQFTHLNRFKEIMVETLADAFKDAFTDEAKDAWTKVIDFVIDTMIKGIKKANENKITEIKDSS